jgi:hypothetical protein
VSQLESLVRCYNYQFVEVVEQRFDTFHAPRTVSLLLTESLTAAAVLFAMSCVTQCPVHIAEHFSNLILFKQSLLKVDSNDTGRSNPVAWRRALERVGAVQLVDEKGAE